MLIAQSPLPSRYHLRDIRLPNGERCTLLCQNGLPLYSPAEFALYQRDTNRAHSTIGFKLRVIGHFLVWCDHHGIVWEERFRSGEFFTSTEIVEIKKWMRLPISLTGSVQDPKQNRAKRIRVAPHIHTTRMLFLRQFLRWFGERTAYSVQGSAHALMETTWNDFLSRWDEIRPKDTASEKPLGDRWGLTPAQCDLFLEVIHPDSPRNPFEPGMRVRNYAQMILLFDHGLRVAESLMLRVDDLGFDGTTSTFCLAERRHDPYDTRTEVPSPKLQHHRSASPRLIVMTARTRKALLQWLDHDRRDKQRFPGALKSPYVFISERGNPLSLRRTNALFEILEETFPELGPRFSPHVLRHTYVERYFEAHPKMTADDREALLWTTGWVTNTTMFSRYAKRGISERAGKASQKLSEARQAATKKQLLAEGWDPDTLPF